ncbi:MAG TPA: hypothetical protein VL117_02560 [Thermoleophilia bacterium]|nr:hypothetical protein [Thermoleophilia bacterium]
MTEHAEHVVEGLPRDLDRFLRDFFPRKRWQSRVQYDHRARRFFLDVTVSDDGLAGDDRFLSLLAYYWRGQRTLLQQSLGLELQCRLFSGEGADLTARLRTAESSYLDDGDRNSAMGRELAWLGFRRRLLRDILPRTFLWGAAIAVLVLVFGFGLTTTLLLCIIALVVQALLSSLLASGTT